jgi:hypothetical protein
MTKEQIFRPRLAPDRSKYKSPRACATRGLLVGGPVDGFVTAAGEGAVAAVSKGEA